MKQWFPMLLTSAMIILVLTWTGSIVVQRLAHETNGCRAVLDVGVLWPNIRCIG